MKNFFEYIIFLALAYLIRLLGLKVSRKFAALLAYIFFYLIPIRKSVTLKNLHLAFPEHSEAEIKKIAFRSYKSFCITLIEILYIPFMNEKQIKNAVTCSQAEMIKEFYNRNNGLILLSGHFGNWEYIALSVSLIVGIPFNVVVKLQRNNYVDKYINRGRTRWINKVVPLGTSIRKIYKELKEKNIVAMVADQRGPVEGIRVNFFNIPSSIYSGPAQLAIKTAAPIIYGLTIRQPDYTYKVILHEISANDLPNDEIEQIRELSQRHMSFLEAKIREYPDHWLWMHNIWKY